MKRKNPFSRLTLFEWLLWCVSLIVVILAFLLSPDKDYLTLFASLIGVTALIFVAKGMIIGQILCIVFAAFYGIISFCFGYYGEMITYLCLSAPIAVVSLISWLKHPFQSEDEVEVGRVGKRAICLLIIATLAVTVGFYFILKALGTVNLIFSSLSVATSFVAALLTFLRSPYYALGYAANDIVLIVLWTLATVSDSAYLPMIFCFLMFLANDIYGFVNWRRICRRQMNTLLEKGDERE